MKILMLCDFYNENLEYQENLLSKYYVKHGHQVTIVTSTFESVFDYYADRHDNRCPERHYDNGGTHIIKLRYRYNILNKLRAFTSITGILDATEPDLIFVHDIMLNLPECVRYMQRHPDCRMIMDYHADYSNSGKNALSLRVLHGICRKWFLDQARPYLSKIFPVVPASEKFLREVYHIPEQDMELLPLGADTDMAQAVQRSAAGLTLRSNLGIANDATVIFTGGKLAPAKRTELLILAATQLTQLALHIVVVGQASEEHAEYQQELQQLAASNPRVHMVGWLGKEDIYRCLDMADLAVFPASQSILWQQAIAMGLPLIVGNTGNQDISYLNLHQNIVILPSDEIRSGRIALAIEQIVSQPSRLAQMRAGAQRVAEEELNWDRLILRTLRFNSASQQT